MQSSKMARSARSDIHPRHRDMAGVIKTEQVRPARLAQRQGIAPDRYGQLVARRGEGYDSVRDLAFRSGLSRAVIERLADADAFRSLGLDRRDALWAVKALDPAPGRQRAAAVCAG